MRGTTTLLYGYLGADALVFLFLTVQTILRYPTAGVSLTLTDRNFCYLFVPLVLAGYYLVDTRFPRTACPRYGSRKKAAANQLLQTLFLGFLVTSIQFFFLFTANALFPGNKTTTGGLLCDYLRYLCAVSLLGCLSVCLRCVGPGLWSRNAEFCSFILLLFELRFLIPEIDRALGPKLYLFFSWFFHRSTTVSCIALVMYAALCLCFLFQRLEKCDWM